MRTRPRQETAMIFLVIATVTIAIGGTFVVMRRKRKANGTLSS
jgi:LPXTG-motif cell wall-anchored protein